MRRSFPYSKRAFVVNMAFLGALIMLTTVVLLMTRIEVVYLAAVLLLELTLFLVLGLSPLFTEHEVHDGVLVLRQGWYFRAQVPICEIRKVSRLIRGPARTGVFFRLLTSTLFVTTRRTDLVEVELRGKRKFGWALGKRADRIVFDVEEPGALINALEWGGSLPPVEPQRPHA